MIKAVKIASRQNERIKEVRKLNQRKYRDQSGLFLAEGVRLGEEALAASAAQELYFSERLTGVPRGQALLQEAQAQGVPLFECTEGVLAELTDTVQAQGVVVVCRKPSWPQSFSGLLLIADEIQDPGNLGTLLRTAVGAGVQGIFLVKGSVDIYNPKVVRSTMGAVLQLPHWQCTREQVLDYVEKHSLPLVVADLEQAVDFWEASYPSHLAVVIGNEARGVHPLFRDKAALRVRIPLVGQVESLNASVAAGVLLYEILRQHRCARRESVL